MFNYFFIFYKIPRIWWWGKWETIWIYFSSTLFLFCLNYAYAYYVLKLWTWYNGWPQNGNPMHICVRSVTLIHVIC